MSLQAYTEEEASRLMKDIQDRMEKLFPDGFDLVPRLVENRAPSGCTALRKLCHASNATKISTRCIYDVARRIHHECVSCANPFEMVSNKEQVSADFVFRNLPTLMSGMIVDFGSFRLLPIQCLAASMLVSPYDDPLEIKVFGPDPTDPPSSSSSSSSSPAGPSNLDAIARQVDSWIDSPRLAPTTHQRLDGGRLPSFRFVDLPTGMGKTAVTISATMRMLGDDEVFERTKQTLLRHYSGQPKRPVEKTCPFSGLTNFEYPTAEEQRMAGPAPPIARLVIFSVPEQLMRHWVDALSSIRDEFARLYGKQLVVWHEIPPPRKRGRDQQAEAQGEQQPVPKSIEKAHQSGDCIAWVKSEQTRSEWIVKPTACHYLALVADQLTMNNGTRDDPYTQRARPCVHFLLLDSFLHLSDITPFYKHHPLSYVYNRSWMSMHDLVMHGNVAGNLAYAAHCVATTSLFSLPVWLVDAVGDACLPLMPSGFIMHRVNFKNASSDIRSALDDSGIVRKDAPKMLAQHMLAGLSDADRGLLLAHPHPVGILLGEAKSSGQDDGLVSQSLLATVRAWVERHDEEWVQNMHTRELHVEAVRAERQAMMRRMVTRAKSFVDKAAELIDGEASPVDPVSLKSVDLGDRVWLGCCSSILDVKSLAQLAKRSMQVGSRPKCPACRSDLTSAGVLAPDQRAVAVPPRRCPDGWSSRLASMQTDEQLGVAIQWFGDKVQRSGTDLIEGIAALLDLCSSVVPSGLRALVVLQEPHWSRGDIGFCAAKRRVLKRMADVLPSSFVVDLIDGLPADSVRCAQHKDTTREAPHVLLHFSKFLGTETVAGLDLPDTHLTVFESALQSESNMFRAAQRSLRVERTGRQEWKHVVVV